MIISLIVMYYWSYKNILQNYMLFEMTIMGRKKTHSPSHPLEDVQVPSLNPGQAPSPPPPPSLRHPK